ncbi:NRDE protein-domain-containing protein [Ephemerocybe angulata]|uniref:NRDE protein-domain-containing protein n=1 Tax=Ephemerocybe angulata TaxID=980116 RepID=A0A8H6HK68_9AGAR|nr:NRDE protein-domain-containing protein [Tulosesus angulatus]
MCIAVWTLDHPDYALILGNNRDEFLDRPTQNAHWHSFDQSLHDDDGGNILSGRDEQAGGSWFGVNKAGRVALLTNITEPLGHYKSTRGYLISSFLQSEHAIDDFTAVLQDLQHQEQQEDLEAAATNKNAKGDKPDSPPKAPAKADLESKLVNGLFQVLSWRCSGSISSRSELRNTVQVAPIPPGVSKTHTTESKVYGTRTTTVLLIKRNGDVYFVERDIWKRGADGSVVHVDPPTQREFRFKLDIDAIRKPEA